MPDSSDRQAVLRRSVQQLGAVKDAAVPPARLPMLFHNRSATENRDAQSLAVRLAQHYALLDFSPRFGCERTFVHRSSTAVAGSLAVTCGYTSPIQGGIGERPGIGSVNLCRAGSASYRIGSERLQIGPGCPLFFSPGHEYRYEADHFNGVVFDLDLNRIRATAAAMAGPAIAAQRYLVDLQRPMLGLGQPGSRAAAQLGLLERLFALFDDLGELGDGAGPLLPLDDLIYRVMALLLYPRLDRLMQEGDGRDGGHSPGRFNELQEWIRANLHRSIGLTELEQRSGYSRRSLQLAFRQHHGCGPIQWIRRQRLEQIRLALLDPDPADSVSTIASRSGYANLSALSRDFRAQFGVRPSDLLRQGRRRPG